MSDRDYECIIGLEVHIALNTRHKLFCECATAFGAPPNTHVCPVCLGMPGALPVLNREAVDFAVRAAFATHGTITRRFRFDRKNYFYPDMPKAYQITQHDLPISVGGYVDIPVGDEVRRIHLDRIHLEEDAGKLTHTPDGTLVDCNRAGVPLIEVVSMPELRSGEEAVAFLRKLRSLVRYTGISDGKMNEGSMRCDINLSVRKKGSRALGTRTEMKNLNSFNYVAQAIESEFKRHVERIDAGETIERETRRFDEAAGTTFAMRKKADVGDYRYYPEPDIPYVTVTDENLESVRRSIPRLADERQAAYIADYGLTAYEAERLTEEKALSDFFEAAVAHTRAPKTLVNLILADVAPRFTEDTAPAVNAEHMGRLADLVEADTVNSNTGRKVLKAMIEDGVDPDRYIETHNLAQINDRDVLAPIVRDVLTHNERAVRDYRNGKKAAMRALIGRVMKATAGRANPVLVESMLADALE